MRKKLFFLYSTLLAFCCLAANAQGEQNVKIDTLEGEAFLKIGKIKKQLGFFLTGETAKALFNAMDGKPMVNNDCHVYIKEWGGLLCQVAIESNWYSCFLGLDLSQDKLIQQEGSKWGDEFCGGEVIFNSD